ncbi:hypothetical protein SASPL_131261 [Salvia splendens]|uniref:Uncharacterized protein n=1 Tax=Salvia splendens TaxID=180675 RepID=A0A8X8ZK57_SALSN|nr:hypothetical protein SASPL_131261 [Salvia splendens]
MAPQQLPEAPAPRKPPPVGSAFHKSIQSLSLRYGPLMLLHFGKVPVLIASSAEEAAQYWRQNRSICVIHLLSSKRVQSYRRVREEETSLLVKKIRKLGASSKPVNLNGLIQSLTNDVISRVAMGKKYGLGSDTREIYEDLGLLLSIVPLWEYIPCLNWTRRFDGLDKRVDRVAKEMDG